MVQFVLEELGFVDVHFHAHPVWAAECGLDFIWMVIKCILVIDQDQDVIKADYHIVKVAECIIHCFLKDVW